MKKRISIHQLDLGMFVHDICGSWMEHPFWRTRFALRDAADLAKLRSSGVREVWIDTERGRDVDGGVDNAASEAAVDQSLAATASAYTPPEASTSLAEELERAEAICLRAKDRVVAVFRDARLGRAIDAGPLRDSVEEMIGSVLRQPAAILGLARIKSKDDFTFLHSVAVGGLMIALAQRLGFDDDRTREIGLGGLLHDIGKTAISDEILNKPGGLTEAEFKLMKHHSEAGRAILESGIDIGPIPLDICVHHHEKLDGSGYPRGLAGDDISEVARMGALCDVYDAITADRRYKAGWNPAFAVRRMTEWCDGHFDDVLFRAFVRTVGIYPPGSLVRLTSGALGLVVAGSGASLLQPTVRVFYAEAVRTGVQTRLVDLSRPDADDAIAGLEDPRDIGFTDIDNLWRHSRH